MNDLSPDRAERSAKLKGLGHSRKRVEDQRFTQGRGNYIDDMKMPDMLSVSYTHLTLPTIYSV